MCPLKWHSFINGPRSLNIGKLLNRDWEYEGCHFCWKHTEACIQLAFPFRKHLKLLFDQKASKHIQGDRREVSRPLRRSFLDDNYSPLNSFLCWEDTRQQMWLSKGHGTKKGGEGNGLVAVAVDKDKGSQNALKWTVENLLSKGQNLILIHVFNKSSSSSSFVTSNLSFSLWFVI